MSRFTSQHDYVSYYAPFGGLLAHKGSVSHNSQVNPILWGKFMGTGELVCSRERTHTEQSPKHGVYPNPIGTNWLTARAA